MHQIARRQRVRLFGMGELAMGYQAELVVDHRHQLLACRTLPHRGAPEQLGDIAHGCIRYTGMAGVASAGAVSTWGGVGWVSSYVCVDVCFVLLNFPNPCLVAGAKTTC